MYLDYSGSGRILGHRCKTDVRTYVFSVSSPQKPVLRKSMSHAVTAIAPKTSQRDEPCTLHQGDNNATFMNIQAPIFHTHRESGVEKIS